MLERKARSDTRNRSHRFERIYRDPGVRPTEDPSEGSRPKSCEGPCIQVVL